jgi:hypothetical protein
MKIHMRPSLPPMPPTPLQKTPQTAFQLGMQAAELIMTAQQQQNRLKKLYGAWRNRRDLDEDTDSETHEQDRRLNQDPVDFLA